MIDSDNCYQLSDNALFQKVIDETVILDTNTGQYFTFDSLASEIIEHLNAGLSVQLVAERIFEDYQAEQATILADTKELISNMVEKGLLIKK